LLPDATVKRVVDAADPAAEGVAACAEMLRELREIPGIAGANIRGAAAVANAVAAIKLAGLPA
ncbi:MAG: methylenetetrahydrofolate reductase, partial [Gammaproteobacteria bacterium]|nr:methylenetetrahydrofolate reductase [Gammaproteobacteria bacterium]